MRRLLASMLMFAVLLAAGAGALGWYGSRHHLPQRQMDDARQAGDGCFLFLGDSRMVAAFDPAALHQELRRLGPDRCLAQLAIGGTDVGGMFLTAREYLSHGRRPVAAVIGKAGDSLLGTAPLRPEDMTANNAIHLIWSRPGDVYTEVPGFPGKNVDAFDAGWRFLLARATPLGRYQSLVSVRVQRLGAWLTGEATTAQNQFGALGDMAALEDTFRSRGQTNLAQAMNGSLDARLGRWFGQVLQLLEQDGVVPIVVELPMRLGYRRAVMATPTAAAYQRWLSDELARRGGALLDLSTASWVGDQLFTDQLHLGAAGAALVSAEIGSYLGKRFARPAP